MAEIVRALAPVPDADFRAMAHYLVSLQPAREAVDAAARVADAARRAAGLLGPAQRMFDAACGACHHEGEGADTEGPNLPLALNPNLHSTRPDNLVRTILDGIARPASSAAGHMPAFRDSLSDRQIAELAAWMRQRFAPDSPPWAGLRETAARLRAVR